MRLIFVGILPREAVRKNPSCLIFLPREDKFSKCAGDSSFYKVSQESQPANENRELVHVIHFIMSLAVARKYKKS